MLLTDPAPTHYQQQDRILINSYSKPFDQQFTKNLQHK